MQTEQPKIQFFDSIKDAMQYIIKNKLGCSFAEYEKILQSKGVIKLKNINLLVDELGLLK